MKIFPKISFLLALFIASGSFLHHVVMIFCCPKRLYQKLGGTTMVADPIPGQMIEQGTFKLSFCLFDSIH